MAPSLPYGTKIDLSNCEREPIHIPGHVQAHGVLLAVEPETLTLLQATDNTAEYYGVESSALIGRPLETLLSSEQVELLRHGLRAEPLERNPLHLLTGHIQGRGPFHLIGHLNEGLLLLEAERVLAGPVRAPDFYTLLKRSVARMQAATTVRDFCQIVTEEVRHVSGYDRVMVYRFLEDWSGEVIAESMTPGLESYLGLRYPASDIPSQARALFLLNTVRMLPDAKYRPARVVPELNPRTGRPLDMSFAFLRGASQMYTEYLINMGVRATLTLAITQGHQLWGMIACHHSTPRQVPYEVRTACEFLARVVSLQVADKQRHEEADYRQRIQAGHGRLMDGLTRQEDAFQGFVSLGEEVRGLLECGGVALVNHERCHLLGRTPTEPQVQALVEWLRSADKNEIFSTSRLASLYPPAEHFQEVASGLLSLPVYRGGREYVLWFRPEELQTVNWAGDPRKPVEVGPLGERLTPRKSFALWRETVRGRSRTWRQVEVEAARRLQVALTEVVLRRSEELQRVNTELRRSNAELDSFAYVASHDLKEPLRGIYNYSSFVLEDYEARLDEDGRERLRTVMRLTKRMQSLIDSLLHFSRIGRTPFELTPVDLNALVDTSLEVLDSRLRETGARVRVPRRLPTVQADLVGLQEVYANLLSNALKYNDKAERWVEVGYVLRDEPGYPARAEKWPLALYVRDNGIGIPEQHAEEVFRIFKRLHPQNAYGGGTGAGLTIVRKVVERHGGLIWAESTEGEGTTFWFTLGTEQGAPHADTATHPAD